MVKVAVAGALGKMGKEVVRAVEAADGLEMVACIDPGFSDESRCCGKGSCRSFTDLAEALEATSPDVLVDFTRPDVVEANLRTALTQGVDCVVGTTGLGEDALAALVAQAPEGTCLFFAPNFAIGAVLMMRFAAEASHYMPKAEIIELHHDKKLDAPSGTALRTASLMEGDSPIHSVRLPGLVAHQEVIFGDAGQTLTIRHDSIDRTSFMPGVVHACREVGGRSGLVVGLENLME
ncbi:MAG: 4-hydroxy-tetrahydrodipicolinate reductase [Coriobacteriia bacterium]|nr:4-hydroxy-tetrahydrodipicolinate reductase [Coriobacteriia bacterium]